MFHVPAWRCAALAGAALVASACHPAPPKAQAAASTPANTSASADLDAVVLADVDDARADLAQRQPLAALNDVNRAFDNASRLQDATPVLYPSEATPGARQHGLLAFDVFVRLTSIQGQLQVGDSADADKGLAAIQAGTPAAHLPQDLPLEQAAEGLTSAQIGIESERPAELAAELHTAEAALDAYRGRRQADAEALANSIATTLKQPNALGALQPDVLQSWTSRVDGWL